MLGADLEGPAGRGLTRAIGALLPRPPPVLMWRERRDIVLDNVGWKIDTKADSLVALWIDQIEGAAVRHVGWIVSCGILLRLDAVRIPDWCKLRPRAHDPVPLTDPSVASGKGPDAAGRIRPRRHTDHDQHER